MFATAAIVLVATSVNRGQKPMLRRRLCEHTGGKAGL